ncbi:unnamed protein product [Trichogramma brassicae]|uniref:long-chain-fatty-acid--CoA ligase n=1 Tax=Trichogramma brassicae TaxID=86971 RepID=A0A6H5IG06_9HYME|nr:unnamed protein product [Trichogramma brassicae]
MYLLYIPASRATPSATDNETKIVDSRVLYIIPRRRRRRLLRWPCPDQVLSSDVDTTCEANGRVRLKLDGSIDADNYKPISVPGLLARTAARHPDHPALVSRPDATGQRTTITYREYERQVRQVAKAFLHLGLERHHSVCILGFNTPQWFISDIAAIYAGGFAAGIYTTNSPEACQYCAESSRANIIVVEDDKQLQKILQIRSQLPKLKAIVQFEGVPQHKDVLSWEDLLELGRQQSEDKLEAVLKTIGVNECCTLVYTVSFSQIRHLYIDEANSNSISNLVGNRGQSQSRDDQPRQHSDQRQGHTVGHRSQGRLRDGHQLSAAVARGGAGRRHIHVHAHGRHRPLRRQERTQGQPPRHSGRGATHRLPRGAARLGEDLREDAGGGAQQRPHQDLDRQLGQGPGSALQHAAHERRRLPVLGLSHRQVAGLRQGQGGPGPGQVPPVRHCGRAAQHRRQEVLHEPGHRHRRRLRHVRVRRRAHPLQQRQLPAGQRRPRAARLHDQARQHGQPGRGRDLHGRPPRVHGLPQRPGEDARGQGREQLAAHRRPRQDGREELPVRHGQDQGAGDHRRRREHTAGAHRAAGEEGVSRAEQRHAHRRQKKVPDHVGDAKAEVVLRKELLTRKLYNVYYQKCEKIFGRKSSLISHLNTHKDASEGLKDCASDNGKQKFDDPEYSINLQKRLHEGRVDLSRDKNIETVGDPKNLVKDQKLVHEFRKDDASKESKKKFGPPSISIKRRKKAKKIHKDKVSDGCYNCLNIAANSSFQLNKKRSCRGVDPSCLAKFGSRLFSAVIRLRPCCLGPAGPVQRCGAVLVSDVDLYHLIFFVADFEKYLRKIASAVIAAYRMCTAVHPLRFGKFGSPPLLSNNLATSCLSYLRANCVAANRPFLPRGYYLYHPDRARGISRRFLRSQICRPRENNFFQSYALKYRCFYVSRQPRCRGVIDVGERWCSTLMRQKEHAGKIVDLNV